MKFSRLTVAIAAAAVLSPVLVATPAWAGDSGLIYSTGNDCVGKWIDLTVDNGMFELEDLATSSEDDDYCYIDYGFSRSLDDKRRFSIEMDVGGTRLSEVVSGSFNVIYFKVCEERENDNDLCSQVHEFDNLNV